jgi:protoheme IX farnesyltransferase
VSSERTATLPIPAMRGQLSLPRVLADYWALTKPDINLLILITTAAGFCLARSIHRGSFPVLLFIHTLAGTLLVASGTATLNQYVERRFDAQMRRTKRRPLAGGRIEPSRALWFGIGLSVLGTLYLTAAVNVLASLLALFTLLSYLLLYTPLKRKTPLCTLVGAFAGAAPPLIGWAAASGTLSLEAGFLYGLVFLWQFPHFMAIAWMYREDYQRAGYLVLPQDERKNVFMAWQTVLPLLGLIALSLTPMLLRNDALLYIAGTLLVNILFSYYGGQLVIRKTNSAARRLLLASILYLPIVFVLIVIKTT